MRPPPHKRSSVVNDCGFQQRTSELKKQGPRSVDSYRDMTTCEESDGKDARVKQLQEQLDIETSRREFYQSMAESCLIYNRDGKRKMIDFYDECRTAMSKKFLPLKIFGQIDLKAVKIAFEKKHGIKPDNRKSADEISRNTYAMCLKLQAKLCGDSVNPGLLWCWRPKLKKSEDGKSSEAYFDKADQVYTDLAKEWGVTLADVAYEERILCHEHQILFPCSIPWNAKEKRKLTPAEIVRTMTCKMSKLNSKRQRAE